MGKSKTVWVDSHAHLTMFDDEAAQEALAAAADAGVAGILVPATGPDDLDRTLELARAHPSRIVAAAGVHPHDASSLDGGMKRRLEAALTAAGVVAVGEIGLDYHYMNSPREDQLRALEWQLDLARDADLPVVLHNRESWVDLEATLGSSGGGLRGVCHSFTEGPREARWVADQGLLVGISGMVTFARGDNIREMAAALDLDEIMVETDSPFLAPVPYRGQRNQPAFVVEVGRRLAQERDLREGEVAEATSKNFESLFRVSWISGGDRVGAARS